MPRQSRTGRKSRSQSRAAVTRRQRSLSKESESITVRPPSKKSLDATASQIRFGLAVSGPPAELNQDAEAITRLRDINQQLIIERDSLRHSFDVLHMLHNQFDLTESAAIPRSRRTPTKDLQDSNRKITDVLLKAIEHAKDSIVEVLSEEWVTRALLVLVIGGTAAFGIHHVFVGSTTAATGFVHEVTQLTHTLRSLTAMIQVASQEASRWMGGSLGSAMGLSAGEFLASMFPQVPGVAIATAASRAAGAYAGFTLFDTSSRG